VSGVLPHSDRYQNGVNFRSSKEFKVPTAHIITLPSGLPVPVVQYNSTIEGEGFYVSFNDYDTGPELYGCETTALVFGQMQAFYILNGDHRAAYAALIPQGFDACLDFFKANIEHANFHSDPLPLAAGG